jgi:hypothetical protein
MISVLVSSLEGSEFESVCRWATLTEGYVVLHNLFNKLPEITF